MSRELPHCDCPNGSGDWDVIKGADLGFFKCKTCGKQGIVFIK